MCHLGEMDYMLVDKTWRILNPSGIHTRHIVYADFFNPLILYHCFDYSVFFLFFTVRRCP